jgi:hypothetical protein
MTASMHGFRLMSWAEFEQFVVGDCDLDSNARLLLELGRTGRMSFYRHDTTGDLISRVCWGAHDEPYDSAPVVIDASNPFVRFNRVHLGGAGSVRFERLIIGSEPAAELGRLN